MDLKAGRYTERGLYGGSKVATLDNDIKDIYIKGLNFRYVSRMEDVLNIVLLKS